MTDFDATEEANARRFKRCDARVRKPFTILPSGAVKHRSPFCRNRPVKGGTRCKFHGGLSTGPVTDEGMMRTVAAMVEGRRRYVERMKAEGRKLPWGRKKGWRDAQRAKETAERAAKVERDRLAAMSPVERLQLDALQALAKLKAHFERQHERRRWLQEGLPRLLAQINEEKAARAVSSTPDQNGEK
jgi:hypothetical protein